ncbi:ankyrin repeat-containing domain protein [Trichophaea hybrida]|nr:ankyrin repeat-containing domain protein [Trichophaea hybrida]
MPRSARSAKSKLVPGVPCAGETTVLFDLLRLPPELIIHIGRFLPRYDLAALLWSSKHMCSLLAPLHYTNREEDLRRATGAWRPRVMELLMDRLSVEPRNIRGDKSLLHLAIAARDPTDFRDPATEQKQLLKTVELLLGRGVPIAEKCSRGNTPLHCAARANWAVVVELLLKRGGAVDVYDIKGDAPIHVAMEGILDSNTVCKASVVEDIVNDPRLDALRTLCKQGASANICTASKSSPLHLAINPRAADHYCNGQYVVGRAIASLLLQHGADPNARDREGLTPLHLAAQKNDPKFEFFELLSATAGINLNAQSSNQLGDTALHHAIRRAQCSCKFPPEPCRRGIITEALLKVGCDVDAINGTRETALHLAADSCCTAAVQALLEKDARVDKMDAKGETAIHISAAGKWEEVLKVLLSKCRREWMEIENLKGHTAWDLVKGRGKKKVVGILDENYSMLCKAEEKAKGIGLEVSEKRRTRSMTKAE